MSLRLFSPHASAQSMDGTCARSPRPRVQALTPLDGAKPCTGVGGVTCVSRPSSSSASGGRCMPAYMGNSEALPLPITMDNPINHLSNDTGILPRTTTSQDVAVRHSPPPQKHPRYEHRVVSPLGWNPSPSSVSRVNPRLPRLHAQLSACRRSNTCKETLQAHRGTPPRS